MLVLEKVEDDIFYSAGKRKRSKLNRPDFRMVYKQSLTGCGFKRHEICTLIIYS